MSEPETNPYDIQYPEPVYALVNPEARTHRVFYVQPQDRSMHKAAKTKLRADGKDRLLLLPTHCLAFFPGINFVSIEECKEADVTPEALRHCHIEPVDLVRTPTPYLVKLVKMTANPVALRRIGELFGSNEAVAAAVKRQLDARTKPKNDESGELN